MTDTEQIAENTTVIEIDDMVTVGNLAEQLSIPVTRLITELMKNGVMATVNERIDFDTAQIIVDELSLGVKLQKRTTSDDNTVQHSKPVASENASTRPPVVAVMGHVDHGKTSLLDAIRGAEVAKGEAGGITQHISAYQVDHKGRTITFLDTPGHEAFAAIREHGALLTDIVVIVIAADDGIKPQTLEAIRFAQKAGAKLVIAANKIDKEGADLNRLKQQLSDNGLLIEEWGGDVIVQPVSAKTKEGLPELLDMILLVSDVEELKADKDGPVTGLIIEAHIEQGRGPVATTLIESGTLHPGDFVVAGGSYAKVRNLESTSGTPLKSAGPSTPVTITGFKSLPEFGDAFQSVANEKLARNEAEQVAADEKQSGSAGHLNVGSNELIRLINRNNELQEFNVIIKADVQGSLTSIIDSLKALDTDEVSVRIVGSGIGAVGENDLNLAHTSGATVYGFSVALPASSRQQASRDKVPVKLYNVIYELIDDVRLELSKLLSPEVIENELGRLIVKGIFKTTKSETICGGEVTKGKLALPALARAFRGNELLMEVTLSGLKRGPAEAKEVFEGELCGVSLSTPKRLELQEGDKLEFFTRETVQRSL